MAIHDRDERKLAELGYRQELERAWSGFSNFAISFTIISVLAGCFTTFGQAWNNGGPIAISIGWPLICVLVLIAAVFAAALFNLWGLDLGIINFADSASLGEIFWVFAVLLALHAVLNIYSSHLVALFNNISVWWHVVGVLVIIGILVVVPDRHQSASFVFTDTINNSGFSQGMFWWYVLPLGFLLTMYTQTGYDASAHVAEETHEAELKVARGLWQSVFWAAVFGWLVLLAITWAAADVTAVNDGGGSSIAVFTSAMSSGWAETVILISTVGQIFCGMAGLTSASRTWYAFSRDRAIPGWRTWVRLTRHRVPAMSVLAMTACCVIVTIPALWGTAAGFPWAFFAVVSITVIGLYIAYVIPVYLRLRAGDSFQPGAWNLGRKYRWMCTVAVVWTVVAMVIFSLPFTPAAVPWSGEFDWTAVNYAPITVLAVIVAVGIWWLVSAKNTYTGPVRTIQFDEAMGIVEEEPFADEAPTPPPPEPEPA